DGEFRVDVARGFELADDLVRELRVAAFERLGGTLETRLNLARVEQLNRFVAQRLLQRVTERLGAVEPVPGLFRERLVNDAADEAADLRVDLRRRRRRQRADRLFHRRFRGRAERLA